jgi:exosortase/archaeosortase family protein
VPVRALAFVIVFATLQLGWQTMSGSACGQLLINQGIVTPAVSLVHLITPNLEARGVGNRLWETRGGINIVNGCDGTETLWMLIAAFLVAPIPFKARISGILIGIPLVCVLNMGRVLALFYAHHTSSELFDFLHGIVTPVLMVLSVAAFYYVWIHRPQHPV